MRWDITHLLKEVSGGTVAAVVSIPSAMGYGIIAFAPLGADYAAMGISAAFLAAILAGLLASLLGGSPGLLSGPKAPLAILYSTGIGWKAVVVSVDCLMMERAWLD